MTVHGVAEELVAALNVQLPPRGTVTVLATVAAADEKRGGGWNGDEAAGARSHAPIGHIARNVFSKAA